MVAWRASEKNGSATKPRRLQAVTWVLVNNIYGGLIERVIEGISQIFIANVHDKCSTLLFLVAHEASRAHNVTNYFSSIVERLLKLSTTCKSSLHGPCNYVIEGDQPAAFYQGCSRLQKLGLGVGKGTVNKEIKEPSCEFESKAKA